MANITLMGASYTDVPAVTLPKTGGGTVTFYENGGGGVSRTVIAAEQTVTASEYFTALSASEGLTEGNVYAYTVDGTEYVGMAVTNSGMLYVNSGFTYAIGDYNGSLFLVTQSTGQHTVKVEELDLSGGGSGTNQDYEDALTAFGVQSNLASGITALTTYANEITGESDTTLSDAVRSLADGYGQGNDDWEYTWEYESGNTQKPLFLEGTASDAADSLLIVKPQMTIAFDNCELEVVAKIGVTNNSRPQLGVGSAENAGFKVFFQADTGYVRSNVTGGFVNYTSDNGFHKIKLKWQNGTATLYVDDVQVASGTGSTSQNFTGIGTNAGTTMSNAASMYFKSIKYRRL